MEDKYQLTTGHPYTILRAMEVYDKGRTYFLVKLRNPWARNGKFLKIILNFLFLEWSKKFRENDPLWETLPLSL